MQYIFKNFEHKTLFNPGTQSIDGQKVTVEHTINVYVEKGKEPVYALEGNTLKVQTPYGTLYDKEYAVKVEPAANDAVESTYIETTQVEEKTPQKIIKGLLRFLMRVPFIVWLGLLGVLFIVVMILNMKKKIRRRKSRMNRRIK